VNIPTARPLWWYYAVAAGCGVLLLGIIVFIMYKVRIWRAGSCRTKMSIS